MSHQQAVQHAERPPLRLRDCYWFFGPLVLMVELNMMSKSVIHAFLARTDNPSAALAAFNAAFTFSLTVVSCWAWRRTAGRAAIETSAIVTRGSRMEPKTKENRAPVT